jgi:hypothetical protein
MRECVVLAKTDQLDDVTSSMMEYVIILKFKNLA